MDIWQDEDVKELGSALAGSFYQCWYEVSDEEMVDVIEGFSRDEVSKEPFINGINKLLSVFESQPEIKEALLHLGYNYDPKYDGMSNIEWLVLIKYYLKGNKNVFEFIPSPEIDE